MKEITKKWLIFAFAWITIIGIVLMGISVLASITKLNIDIPANNLFNDQKTPEIKNALSPGYDNQYIVRVDEKNNITYIRSVRHNRSET